MILRILLIETNNQQYKLKLINSIMSNTFIEIKIKKNDEDKDEENKKQKKQKIEGIFIINKF